MFASMKRLLSVLGVAAALAAFAGPGNALTVVLCIDGGEATAGCVAGIPTSAPLLFVGSDGESVFDPFGAGFDTSDGIQLNSSWAPDPAFAASFGAGLWTQIADPATGGFTWVLPSVITGCGAENEPTCEPVAKWYFTPGSPWNAGTPDILLIFEGAAFASDLSDVILVNNTGGPNGTAASITFFSDPATFPSIPEPASLALIGIGMAGLAFARRRKS
jgi:hypothetical protein